MTLICQNLKEYDPVWTFVRNLFSFREKKQNAMTDRDKKPY
jgi:hypothetical protein